MKRKAPLAVASVFCLTALAACGGSSSDGDTDTKTKADDLKYGEAASGFKQVPDAQGPAPDVEGAVKGGTITFQVPLDPGPEDLDPTNGWSVLGNSFQQDLTHRELTQYRRNPETGEMELVPDLATDLGTPNADFTEWKFTLRDGVKWENGDPVTAEEIKHGLERSMDAETFTGGPGQAYSNGFFDCGKDYAGPTKSGDCKGITVDGNDITIKMEKPFPDFNFYSTFMAMGPIPLKNSEFPAYGRKPLSTGPYKIESFRPNEELVLVKNDQWDPATDPARHQYADKWVIKFAADQEKVDQTLLADTGEGQTTISNRVNSTNVKDLSAKLGDNFIQQTGQCVSYISPDYTKITDINVRKAIAYGYDFNNIMLAQGEVPGVTRIPATAIMPPGMSGRKEYNVDGDTAGFTYDPDKSKALLKEAGYEPGDFKLTWIYDDSVPEIKAANDQRMKGYEAAGFAVEAIPYQEDAYDLYQDKNSPINKKLNMRGTNWCSDWPAASTMIPPLYKAGQAYNTSYFNEAAIDAKMDEIPTMEVADQPAAWGDLDEEIITEYLPMIPTAYRNDLFGAGSKIGGFSGNAAMSAINFKDLYVKQ